MSAWCSASVGSARMPPCTFGCRVTTRWPRMAGNPVRSATSVTGTPASAITLAVPPLEISSHPSSWRAEASSTTPVLSYTDSRAFMTSPSSSWGARPSGRSGRRTRRSLHRSPLEDLLDGLDVELALDVLDALVQGLDGVVGQDPHRLLGQDRSVVDLRGRHVHRAPGDLHPGVEGGLDGVPPLERRQQRRVGVDDVAGEHLEHGRSEDGAPAGHHHQVDVVLLEHLDDLAGVVIAVERSAEAGALDDLPRHTVALGHLGGAARP